jgi:site-specific DNA-methyltransferase (adenine-specific)
MKSMPKDTVLRGDCITRMKQMPAESVHLILSDIPYGIGADDWDVLHDNTNSAYLGSSPAQSRAGKIFKSRGKPINGWSEADRAIPRQYSQWCSTWTAQWLRLLKPGGSAIVFAGRRLAHRCTIAMEDDGFSFKDMLAWTRERAPHRAQRLSLVYERRGDKKSTQHWDGWRIGNLRPTFEPILWFTKPYKIGSTIADNALLHGVGPFNEKAFQKYMQRPDNVLDCGFDPKEAGLHPTQKPVRLMLALIELTTQPGQMVFDPFAGSGSTLVAAKSLGRSYLGIEENAQYAAVAQRRLKSIGAKPARPSAP